MASAVAFGGSGKASSWIQSKNSSRKNGKNSFKNLRVSCVSSAASDPYKTLKIHRGASEWEVKKAFRKLALKYHPDVCRGSNCSVQFHQINEAYDIVMSNLRGKPIAPKKKAHGEGLDDSFRRKYDRDGDLWEEWMGWEGAGIRDYTSHINPYI